MAPMDPDDQFHTGSVAQTNDDATVGNLDVHDVLTIHDELVHAAVYTLTKTANYTVTAADSGTYFRCGTDGVIFTLPSTVVGLSYTFVNTGDDAAAGIQISPAAADKITGIGFTAADNKDAINTKATAKHGDYLRIQGDGVDGWMVVEARGTWAREA